MGVVETQLLGGRVIGRRDAGGVGQRVAGLHVQDGLTGIALVPDHRLHQASPSLQRFAERLRGGVVHLVLADLQVGGDGQCVATMDRELGVGLLRDPVPVHGVRRLGLRVSGGGLRVDPNRVQRDEGILRTGEALAGDAHPHGVLALGQVLAREDDLLRLRACGDLLHGHSCGDAVDEDLGLAVVQGERGEEFEAHAVEGEGVLIARGLGERLVLHVVAGRPAEVDCTRPVGAIGAGTVRHLGRSGRVRDERGVAVVDEVGTVRGTTDAVEGVDVEGRGTRCASRILLTLDSHDDGVGTRGETRLGEQRGLRRSVLVGVVEGADVLSGGAVDGDRCHAVTGCLLADELKAGAVEGVGGRRAGCGGGAQRLLEGRRIVLLGPRAGVGDGVAAVVVGEGVAIGSGRAVQRERQREGGGRGVVRVVQTGADEAGAIAGDRLIELVHRLAVQHVDGGANDILGIRSGDGVHARELRDGVLPVAELLLHGELRRDGAVLVEGCAVVVRREAGGGRTGVAPVGAADDHVVVEVGDAVGKVADAELAGEGRVGVVGTVVGTVVCAPGGERAALGLSDELRGVGLVATEGGFAVAEAVAASRAVEAQRVLVVGVEVETVLLAVGEASAHAVVVVELGHGDAVLDDLVGQRLQERLAGLAGAEEFVLHLVQQQRAAAVGDLVLLGDLVERVQPRLGRLEDRGVGGAQVLVVLVHHPLREATHGHLRVDVGAGTGHNVEALLGCHREERVDVAGAGEVEVPALLGLVHSPEEVEAHGVEARSAELLHDVAPPILRRDAPVVELAGPQVNALTVDEEGALVEAHVMWLPVVAGKDDLVAGVGDGVLGARIGRGHETCDGQRGRGQRRHHPGGKFCGHAMHLSSRLCRAEVILPSGRE